MRKYELAESNVSIGPEPAHESFKNSARTTQIIIRGLDIFISASALLFLLPVMVALAMATWVGDPGSIFFGHLRIGKNGVSFRCFKFRTMVSDAEHRLTYLLENDSIARAEWDRDRKLTRDPRITRTGRFMRKSSLDELPQLWNVIRGEMSLIGPRPIVKAEVPRYGKYIADYMTTRPGISGLWQISGRNDTSYRRRIALDVAFARSQSLRLYLKILILTVPAVLLQRGSY